MRNIDGMIFEIVHVHATDSVVVLNKGQRLQYETEVQVRSQALEGPCCAALRPRPSHSPETPPASLLPLPSHAAR